MAMVWQLPSPSSVRASLLLLCYNVDGAATDVATTSRVDNDGGGIFDGELDSNQARQSWRRPFLHRIFSLCSSSAMRRIAAPRQINDDAYNGLYGGETRLQWRLPSRALPLCITLLSLIFCF
ncbi:hypothetical protein S245_036658 [Arachis hypogaea]